MPDDPVRSGFDGTERLARRVLDGEVVFFVGSGFSIDSEHNDAKRLVGRLLATILAMGTVLGEEAGDDRNQSRALLGRLRSIFSLTADGAGTSAREPARTMTDANLKLLAREYYNFNEWATSALGVLSAALLDLQEPRSSDAAARTQKLATFLLSLVNDPVPLDPIDCTALREFASPAARGKALFLDAMGFNNLLIMAGTPLDADLERVIRSYEGRLRPRHHALARLAREGLAPALITTNYDLLLEGAYRLAGFVERVHADSPDGTPSDQLPRFSTIAGASQFFAKGQGYRTSLLLKIHGCVQAYRDARKSGAAMWAAYLPALVFTYREIQTWRADAWSRDLIRTMLRTHTIALCGYSGADPIMHSTFREVYDEKASSIGAPAQKPAENGSGRAHAGADDASAEHASVFFFGLAGRREFHSLELLRAATIAAGLEAGKLVEHPNHLEFETADGFPTIDDHFRWLIHTTVREIQTDALARLRRLVPRMLRREQPLRDLEVELALDQFRKLRALEARSIGAVHPPTNPDVVAETGGTGKARLNAERRLAFERIAGWTWHFVPGYLRQLSLAETVENYRGAGRAVRSSRTPNHYFPVSERPEWTAWAVIVELALRHMVATLNNETTLMPTGLLAEESPYAAISFRGPSPWQPLALCIQMAGFDRPDAQTPLTGAFHHITCWDLREQDVPWPMDTEQRAHCEPLRHAGRLHRSLARREASDEPDRCPSPQSLWKWATGELVSRDDAAWHLGVTL